jgi:predicted restriction endonuclease
MKECTICKIDISHKKSNAASKCEKCARIINEKTLTKIKARTKNMKNVKREILTAYNVSCVICGWSIKNQNIPGKYQHQRGCEIHHIKKISEGGKDVFENCVLLCPNHHKEADLGIISEAFLFSYVIKNKQEVIEKNTLNMISHAFGLLEGMF